MQVQILRAYNHFLVVINMVYNQVRFDRLK